MAIGRIVVALAVALLTFTLSRLVRAGVGGRTLRLARSKGGPSERDHTDQSVRLEYIGHRRVFAAFASELPRGCDLFVTIDLWEELAMAPLAKNVSRRSFLTASTALAAAALGRNLLAREYGPHTPPTRYPDADIIALDPRFKKYAIGNSAILRLYHSQEMMWAEGCAWNGVGRYLVWSDIPNNIQRRWLEEDGHVSVFRNPAQYSNGNTFDYQGRQLSFQHETRRVVRYEADGSVTVLASTYNNKSLNAPNDGIVHPNGDVWFTDPGYGAIMNYEGVNANNGSVQPYQKESIYRIDSKTGKLHQVADDIFKPNGICFSPDYKKLYVADTGASHYPNAPRNIKVWDVVSEQSLANGREFASMKLAVKDGGGRTTEKAGFADGIRADVDGNIWASAGWVGHGYDGVHVFEPNEGVRIGQILLPEICGNVCFGGTKRNRLFMAASTSLYALYVETKGAHIA